MHMADALISPVVAGTMWAVSTGALSLAAKNINRSLDEDTALRARGIALSGLLAAFVFAAQMINFTIPGTGSSGHISGGLLLAILLGPRRALVALASVLCVQALFFADGGILAYGCNVFIMGVVSAFVGYPIYAFIAGRDGERKRTVIACVVAGIVSALVGAFAVVLETTLSGITVLPFGLFTLSMLPIHFAIGLVEGLATAAVVVYVRQQYPDLMKATENGKHTLDTGRIKKLSAAFAVGTVLLGGVAAWYASSYPDGLEWSIARVAGGEIEETPGFAAALQDKLSFLPDYNFKGASASDQAINAGTSASGLVGAALTFVFVAGFYVVVKNIKKASGVPRA